MNIVMDAASRRHKDENGFLHVGLSHISKETVNPYYGREIPGWEERGLDPDRVYHGYRAGSELAEAAATFNGLPLLRDHHVESAEVPQKEHRVGSLGTDAAWRPPYLDNSLIVTDAGAIREIETGARMELSAAYKYEPDFTPGEFAGQPYDFVMRAIRGNHVALVCEGRAGPDVVVADHALPGNARDGVAPRSASAAGTTLPASERASRAGRAGARHPESGRAGPDVVVADHALPGKLHNLNPTRKNMGTSKRFRGAQDADPEQREVDLAQAIIDLHKTDPRTGQVTDIGEDAGTEAEVRKVMAELAGKLSPEEQKRLTDALARLAAPKAAAEPATDAEPDEAAAAAARDGEPDAAPKAEEGGNAQDEEPPAAEDAGDAPAPKSGAAMDSAALLRHVQAIQDAQAAVRPYVGEIHVNLAADDAGTVYGAALDALGIDRRGQPRAALRGMFQVAVQQRRRGDDSLGMDAALGGDMAALARITNL